MDALLLGGSDGVVETGNTVLGVVVEILAAGIEDLVVDVLGFAWVVGAAEAPYSSNFIASLGRCKKVFLGFGNGELTAAIWATAPSTSTLLGR